MNKNIRGLEDMPLNIKFLYGKILAAMVCAGDSHNQLKLAEFYRIINKVQLPSGERIQLMNSIITKNIDFLAMCDEIDLDGYLNGQEKNIFRFSLMKDLIIIMRSDYFITDSEKRLLKSIQGYFQISDEQLSFFDEEYESDRCFFDDVTDDRGLKKIAVNTISTATALGVPLVVLNYSGRFRGLGILGMISGLRAVGMKKKAGRGSIVSGLLTSILLGITTYKVTRYVLNAKKNEKAKLVRLMREDIERLHEGTKGIIYEDIEYFTNRMVEIGDGDDRDPGNIPRIINILKRAAATLENTEAVVI